MAFPCDCLASSQYGDGVPKMSIPEVQVDVTSPQLSHCIPHPTVMGLGRGRRRAGSVSPWKTSRWTVTDYAAMLEGQSDTSVTLQICMVLPVKD